MNGGIINNSRTILHALRLPNILLLAVFQLLIYLIFIDRTSSTDLSSFALLILLPSVISISLGYVVNDLIDQRSDQWNKKRSGFHYSDSIKYLKDFSFYLGVLALLCTLYYALNGAILNALIYLILNLLTIWYSLRLKCVAFLGNIVVAVLTIIGVIWPIIILKAWHAFILYDFLLVFFTLLVFFITLMREVVKDYEDIRGDKKVNCRTAPVVFKSSTVYTYVYILVILTSLIFLVWFNFTPNFHVKVSIILLKISFLISFYLYFYKQKAYSKLSKAIKLTMVLSCLPLLLIYLN